MLHNCDAILSMKEISTSGDHTDWEKVKKQNKKTEQIFSLSIN